MAAAAPKQQQQQQRMAESPAPGAPAAPAPTAPAGGAKPPSGYEAIPHSHSGGFRKKEGDSYTYWYPPHPSGGEDPHVKQAQKMKTPLPHDLRVHMLKMGVGKFPGADAHSIKVHHDADPTKGSVASWKDGKGRTQHAYAAEFLDNNAHKKWKRVEALEHHVDGLRKDLSSKIMNSEVGSKSHQSATIAAVIAETGLRPGGKEESVKEGHYGVSDLKGEHVDFVGDEAHLKFIGKAGKENKAVVKDPETVKALHALKSKAGDGPLFSVGPDEARQHLPKGMKLKDLRTILATKTAREALKSVGHPPPLDPDEKKAKKQIAKAWMDTSKVVSDRLNNTPAIARGSYIHPKVLENWVSQIGGSHLVLS